VTRAQLRTIGVADDAIAHRVRKGRLYRVHRGVFAVGRPPRTPLERASAAVLACGPSAALSHASALALWGFSDRWPTRFDVAVTLDRRPRGIIVHRSRVLTGRDIRLQLSVRATSPARTVLDCARTLEASGRLTRVVNDALHTPFLTQSQLADVRHRFSTHPGAKLLDPFLEGNPTRSPFEDDFLEFCETYGLPRPVVNARVAGHGVDALFPAHRLIVELDGWEFHHDRHAFETDRERDADTLAAGFSTVRITHERLTAAAAAEADHLHRILSERQPA
jgi:hypothetical protein